METQNLYRVTKEEELEKVKKLLTVCFEKDPLYCYLIPDEDTRKRLLPELFSCDLTEFYETCQIYADSPELNGVLIVSDEAEPYNLFKYYLTETQAALRTDGYLIKEDPTLKTFWNFIMGRDYLNSRWTDQLHQNNRLHIIYLAVNPEMQHHGIAAQMMEEVIHYAEQNHMMISLETHNEKIVAMYEHFGFKLFGIVKKHFELKQYCLIREVQ